MHAHQATRCRTLRGHSHRAPRAGPALNAFRGSSRPTSLSLGQSRGVAAHAAATDTVTGAALLELTPDTIDAYIAEQSASKLVVVDFYTQWCGPCKLILPDLIKLNQELGDKAEIVKFDCKKEYKDIGKRFGIRVAPTFHVYKAGEKVGEMTGAKVDNLRALIDKSLAPPEPAAEA